MPGGRYRQGKWLKRLVCLGNVMWFQMVVTTVYVGVYKQLRKQAGIHPEGTVGGTGSSDKCR